MGVDVLKKVKGGACHEFSLYCPCSFIDGFSVADHQIARLVCMLLSARVNTLKRKQSAEESAREAARKTKFNTSPVVFFFFPFLFAI